MSSITHDGVDGVLVFSKEPGALALILGGPQEMVNLPTPAKTWSWSMPDGTVQHKFLLRRVCTTLLSLQAKL